jgi:hypothetical protein
MDIGTAKDMIEDMHHEIIALRRNIKTLERIAEKAYPQLAHHEGCLTGMM